MKTSFLDRVEESVLLCDGAMGTMLYARGIYINRCFDELNLSQPDLVKDVHVDYLRAGAEIIESNTFGANRFKLLPHGLEDKVSEINRAGVELARKAIETTHRDAYVAGSVGPLGNPLQSLVHVGLPQIQEIYREQIAALVDAGVDLLIIETISRREEMAVALEVAASFDVPVVALMTFSEEGRTVHGESAEDLGAWMRSLGASVVGANCSIGPRPMLDFLESMSSGGEVPVAALPNAGTPEWVEGRCIYFSSPEYMATYARRFIKGCGVRLVGGCCGTTPDHIRAMHDVMLTLRPTRVQVGEPRKHPAETPKECEPIPFPERSRLAAKLAAGEFATSVEISPPRGVNPEKILERVQSLRDAGVDAVNIPDGPRASARMSPMALGTLVGRHVGIEVILHYCCRDRNLLGMQSDLLGAHALGIRNLIIITGDPPKLGDYPNATAVFDVDSIGLTRIVSGYNRGLDLAGSPLGGPTSFLVGVGANPGAVDLDEEVRRMEQKVANGAEAIFTQPVFDLDRFEVFLDRTSEIPIPIMVGILPLNSHRNAEFFHNEVPGMNIPDDIRERMRKAGSGDTAKQKVSTSRAKR